MAYNYSMQPTLPPDTNESPSLGAKRIRDFKNALIERLTSWIYGIDTAGSETEIGLKSAPFRVQTSAPATPTNGVQAYAKDSNSTAELFVKDEAGTEVQITRAGVLANVGTAYETKDINTEYSASTNLMIMFATSSYVTPTVKIASDINFANIEIEYEGNSTGQEMISLVVPKGYYYKVQSASSGTYKVIKI